MRLHLFGNCQIGALKAMMLEDHPDWSISTTDLTSDAVLAPEAIARHNTDIAEAEIIVSQPVKAWKGVHDLSSEAIEAIKRPSAHLITFPSILFEGTHGAFTYLQHRLHGFEMPYHNSHTIDMFARSYRRGDVILLQNSREFYTEDFVHAGMKASLAELKFRETAHEVSVRVSDMFESDGWSRVLMNAINHPKRAVLANVLNKIYRAMSEQPVAKEAGAEYLPNPVIPPLPTVLHHLAIADEAPCFMVGGIRYSREEYIGASLDYYGRLLRQDLLGALAASRGQAFLAAFHGGEAGLAKSGAQSAELRAYAEEWVRNAYQVFFDRTPASWEIEFHLNTVLDVGIPLWLTNFANSDEFRDRHGVLLPPREPAPPAHPPTVSARPGLVRRMVRGALGTGSRAAPAGSHVAG